MDEPKVLSRDFLAHPKIYFVTVCAQVAEDASGMAKAFLRREIRARFGEEWGAQARFAKEFGVTEGTVSQWISETGHGPGLDKLGSLAEFFGGTVANIFAPRSTAPNVGTVSSAVTGLGEVHVEHGAPEARVVELEAENAALAAKARAYEDVLDAIDGFTDRYREIKREDRPADRGASQRNQRG